MPSSTIAHHPARPLALALIAILLLVAFPPAAARAAGATWCVSSSGATTAPPCSNVRALTSLQAAVNSASPGDTIQLARGGYTGGPNAVVTITNTALTIVGGYSDENWTTLSVAPALTAIDGQGLRRGVQITGASVAFVNLTIQNGRVGSPTNLVSGGALIAEQNQQDLVILDTVIVRNSAAGGSGGGAMIFGDAEFYEAQFLENRAGEDGAGFWVGGKLTYEGGLVQNNSAQRSGGGGTITSCACSDLRFLGNTASNGVGGGLQFSEASTVARSVFADNRAGNSGGAIGQDFSRGSLLVGDSLFVRNLAQELPGTSFEFTNSGGAITVRSNVTVLRSHFDQNRSNDRGGAVAQADIAGTVAVQDSRFTGNSATGDGGAIALIGSVNVARSEFQTNTAGRNGGAVAQIDPQNGRGPSGSAVFTNVSVRGNTAIAGNGGGIAVVEPVQFVESVAIGNTAGGNGGGIAMVTPLLVFRDQPVLLRASRLLNNSAPAGSGGGAYIQLNSGLQLQGLVVQGNSAGLVGGGITVSGGSSLSVTGALFADNSATQSGNAFALTQGQFGSPASVVLANLTVASAQPRAGDALAFQLPTVSVALHNTLVTSHTIGLRFGLTAPGSPPNQGFAVSGDHIGLFGVETPVLLPSGPAAFAPNILITTDPLFANPAAGDYRLRAGSPLIDRGDPARDYSGQIDATGRAMPLGAGAEIGALEFFTVASHVYLPLLRQAQPFPDAQ